MSRTPGSRPVEGPLWPTYMRPKKLDEDKVREIKEALRAGESQRAIAARFGVGQTIIGMIRREERWGWVR